MPPCSVMLWPMTISPRADARLGARDQGSAHRLPQRGQQAPPHRELAHDVSLPARGACCAKDSARPRLTPARHRPRRAQVPHECTRSAATVAADDSAAIAAFAANTWDEQIVPALTDYIAIPAKSPMFDADWQRNGHIERVVRDAASWVESRRIAGLKLEVIRLEGRTPVIFFEVPATRAGSTGTICLYGHLDKQPEFNGWRKDLGPWTPKYENGLLCGRGGADDGYAIYASITAIEALDRQGIARPRCVGLIETCEERLLRPAGPTSTCCARAWARWRWSCAWTAVPATTTSSGSPPACAATSPARSRWRSSPRHPSGDSSGLVPSSFRILRQVLDRLEDAKTGGPPAAASFHCEMPADRPAQARHGRDPRRRVYKRLPGPAAPMARPALPTTTDPTQACINRTWKPRSASPAPRASRAEGTPATCCALHGLQALAAAAAAGGRQPRRRRTESAARRQRALQRQGDLPPMAASVRRARAAGTRRRWRRGWSRRCMPRRARILAPCGFIGQGGTIPLMGMLQQGFPRRR